MYIDRSTVEREMYVVTMSVLHDYEVPENIASGSFLSFTAEQQYDCAIRQSRCRYLQSTWATGEY